MSDHDSSNSFVQVACDGEERIGKGEPLVMTLGSVTDPELAFRIAFFGWSLWEAIREYETFMPLLAPEHLGDKLFEVQAIPTATLPAILADALALAQRIEQRQRMEWLGKVFDTTGVTLRVKVWRTTFDVTATTDTKQLIDAWRAIEKDDIPTFGCPLPPDTIIGAESMHITS